MIDGDELEQSYKHHLSDYSEWEQRDHASNWMLIKDNLGENLSKGDFSELQNGL